MIKYMCNSKAAWIRSHVLDQKLKLNQPGLNWTCYMRNNLLLMAPYQSLNLLVLYYTTLYSMEQASYNSVAFDLFRCIHWSEW